MEGLGQAAAAIVGARQNTVGATDQAPHQLEGLTRISRRDHVEDSSPLDLQLSQERFDLLPSEPGLRLPDADQLLGDSPRRAVSAAAASQGQAKLALRSGITLADCHEQFREPGGTERFQVRGVERLTRRGGTLRARRRRIVLNSFPALGGGIELSWTPSRCSHL
jgi:hypothetical protein